MKIKDLKIVDAHTHFFSISWFEQLQQRAGNRFSNLAEVSGKLLWSLPPGDPVKLGELWVNEQDKYGVKRQVLFASKLNDAELLAAATNAFPDRLLGYAMINPHDKDARNQIIYSIEVLGMHGILLFPAMFHFHAYEEKAYTIYEEALSASVPVFIHFGKLDIPVFRKLGVPDEIDLSYSSPLDVQKPAADFPEITFIMPHFGCGRFQEALQMARQYPNICFDTSSSNSWIDPPLNLREVFRRSLDTMGFERLLFGTDSSFFPRGWRRDIYETQLGTLNSLGLSRKEKQAIFGGNIERILQLD